MAKKPTLKSMENALTAIANMDFGISKEELLEMDMADGLDLIVTFADSVLNPVEGPSALEVKTKEVAEFFLDGNFKMIFASNDTIGAALNDAGILSPSGKPWTRTNVSKVMVGVRELVVERVQPVSTTEEF